MKLQKQQYGDALFATEPEYIDLELFEYKDVKAWTRPGTSDSFVVREVMSGEYRKLDIKPTDVIVDFGMNIGMFSIFAANKGAKRVHGYEADAENFDLACTNINLNNHRDVITPNNRAVVGNDDETRQFSINTQKNKGAHSLVHKRGRDTTTVKCINVNTVLEQVKPTIVKMDIEGAEYEVLKAINDYSGIEQLIFEFHHAHLLDQKDHSMYNEILELMRSNFPNVEAREEVKGAWVNIVYCHR